MPRIRNSKKYQLWQERLREFRSGQETVRQFCQRLGVSQANFYYWKRKLAANGGQRGQPTSRPAHSGSFLPLFVKPRNRSVPHVSIQLPSGVRIRIPIEASTSSGEA